MAPTTALQFSGGKDSLVVLHMHRHQLDEILVTWTNTGAAYPEVVAQMDEVARSVPHFLEVRSNQPECVTQHGYPTDLVPLHFTPMGRTNVKSPHSFRVQDTFSCCAHNIWRPMDESMRKRGVTRIIRGQRRSERYTSPITDGYVENGIEYRLPIENWNDAEVFAYLKENSIPVPPHYATESKSHDCWSCTGYLDEDGGRISHLPEQKRAEVLRRLAEIDAAIQIQRQPLSEILETR